jgi:uncharacterized protein (TIGR02284 family)
MDSDKVISTLNGLIETVKDGEFGFKTAAEGMQDLQVRSLFQQYSRQRAEMARELRRNPAAPRARRIAAGSTSSPW